LNDDVRTRMFYDTGKEIYLIFNKIDELVKRSLDVYAYRKLQMAKLKVRYTRHSVFISAEAIHMVCLGADKNL
jgi:hypothetical protein